MATGRAAPKPTSVVLSGQPPTTRERFALPRVNFTAGQLKKSDGATDHEGLARQLNALASYVQSATLPARSHPLGQGVILQQVTVISGVQAILRHGLGAPFGYYHPIRSYATYVNASGVVTASAPWAAVEVDLGKWPSGATPDQHLVLLPSASGKYDLFVAPA